MNRADVEKIAHLARLDITEEEAEAYASDLSSILALVEQMNSVDTEDVTPMAHPLHMAQRLRVDEITEVDQRKLYQSTAPLTEAGLYLVPRVIDQG